MSLVYEALQKAEREKKKRSTGVAPVPPAPLPVAATRPAPAQRRYLPLLIVGVSVIAVAAIAYFVVTAMKNAAPVAEGGSRSSATAPELAARPEPRPAPRGASPPETVIPPPVAATENDSRFKLTGITKIGDDFGAVVNGHVVYAGNYVEGAIVKKVERDRVTLDLNGREIVVRLF